MSFFYILLSYGLTEIQTDIGTGEVTIATENVYGIEYCHLLQIIAETTLTNKYLDISFWLIIHHPELPN